MPTGSYLAIAGGLLLTLAVVGASAALAVRISRALDLAFHKSEIRETISTLVDDLTDAETGQRGFLLTSRDAYLAPYRRGVADAMPTVDRLAAELADYPAVRPDLARLRALVSEKVTEMDRTVLLASAGKLAEAIATVRSDDGQRSMEAIRVLASGLAARQTASLAAQFRAVDDGGRLIVLIDAIGFGMLLLLGGTIIWSSRRAMRVLGQARTELARANAELEGLNERLEFKVAQRTADLTAANDEIQRFAYIVSHDLRAPLVNIMGFTGELEAANRTISDYVAQHADVPGGPASGDVVAATSEDLPEAIRFIKASSAKMDRLINAILKLSREGRRIMAPERIEMQPFLQGIADSLQHQADESGARIVIGKLPVIQADRLMLEQVFSNLLENALKYLMPGREGHISVGARIDGNATVFEVVDNGRGIAAQDLDRVFELFRRAGDQRVPGEGIGLAHVRALVRRLGGTIDCESREGVGSTFRVALPGVAYPTGAA